MVSLSARRVCTMYMCTGTSARAAAAQCTPGARAPAAPGGGAVHKLRMYGSMTRSPNEIRVLKLRVHDIYPTAGA